MKIGAFADKYNLKKSTIRYYTDINLLLPLTSGTYPDYDEKSTRDMDDIIKYKALGFSIEEIQRIKKLERFAFKESNSYMNHMQNLFENKIATHKETIDSISLQVEDLEKKLLELKTDEPLSILGVPFNSFDLLKCPLCHEKFTVQNASIENKQVQNGNLTCSCGHNFKIENGILMQTQSKSTLLREVTIDDLDHSDTLTNEHMALMKKAGESIKSDIKSWDHSRGIVFTNADTDIFLMSLEDIFIEEGIYILCSFEIESLKNLKRQFELQNLKGNFLFIHYLDYLPLNNSIYYLIDNAGRFFDYTFGYESNSILRFIDLFSDNSEAIVIELDAKLKYIPLHLSTIFDKNSYFDIYKKADFEILSKTDIGVLRGISDIFPKLNMLNDVYMSSYVLKKISK